MKRQFALIPAYKPNENLISFIQSLETRGLEVVVVNDGSGEDHLPLFHKIQEQSLATVIHLEKNQGKGAALKAGLSYLNTVNDDFQVITLDADGQHSLQDALFLLQKSLENEGSLLLGSRAQSKDSPLRSRIGNYITKKVFSLTTGVRVEDTQTGMRAFSKQLIPKLLKIQGNRYEYEMNMLLDFAKEGIPIQEYPIETIYINDNEESHFDTVKDSIRIYSQILKFISSSLLSFCIDFLLYTLSLSLSGSILFSNAFARLISLHCNFFMNKNYVFQNASESTKREHLKEYLSYLGLALSLFAMNTLLLSAVVEVLGVNAYLAKIITEILLFILSYFVQKHLIFSKQEKKQTLRRNVHHKEGRNPLKRLNTKKAGLLYGLVLFSYTSYALLDTFVIPHPMKTVLAESANIEATSGIKESIEAKINEKLGLSESAETSLTENTNGNSSYSTGQSTSEAENSSGSAGSSSEANDTSENSANTGGSTNLTASSTVEGGTVIGSYSDSNVSITLKEYREYDSAIYVADVTVSDVSYLKTALASNTYGRNITDTTSDMASENNAILAINGDYYGARQSGYVIRNGNLYRNSSGNRDALAIMKNGEFEFVTEGETSAETLLENGALQVFSFGPVLLEDGSISVTENDEVGMAMASNPRTAIGYLGKNHYVFVVSDGRTSESAGLSLYELASFMKNLGVVDAYNLDGGGSSTMVFKGEVINTPTTNGHSTQERAVSDILYIGGKQS